MPTPRKPATSGDTTGRQTQRAAQRHAAELAQKQEELAMTRQVERADDTVLDPVAQQPVDPRSIVTDLSEGPVVEETPPRPDPVFDPTGPTMVVEMPEPVAPLIVDETVEVRCREDVVDMVYGDPYTKYNLTAGRRYRVRAEMAAHLKARDLIY